MEIYKLPDNEYKKAVGQLRLQLGALLKPLRLYGQDIAVDGIIPEIIKLAEDFSLRCRGVDKPISIEYVRRKR
uniref:Uncharacterized protein n=1 Tax=viral metagenome TaxID=1070528 RepID=A0A6M3LFP7_9ZZZZ